MFNAFLRLFVNGIDLDLETLYPRVKFPVSCGTQMIAPHIRWDHSENSILFSTDDAYWSSSERIVEISLETPDMEYISGHVINGNNFFHSKLLDDL